MEGLTIATLVTVIVNLILAAFFYGKLTQKVEDVCRRMDKVEERFSGRTKECS